MTEQTQKLQSEELTERQKGIEEGYQAAINDADSGVLRGLGIYTTSQVMDFIEMYKTAIQQSLLNDVKGYFHMGGGKGHELHLVELVLKEADSKFSGTVKAKQNVG